MRRTSINLILPFLLIKVNGGGNSLYVTPDSFFQPLFLFFLTANILLIFAETLLCLIRKNILQAAVAMQMCCLGVFCLSGTIKSKETLL